MDSLEKQLKLWRCVAIIALSALLAVGVLYALGAFTKRAVSTPVDGNEALSLWNDGRRVL